MARALVVVGGNGGTERAAAAPVAALGSDPRAVARRALRELDDVRRAPSAALLVAAIAAAAIVQGGYFFRGQVAAAALIAAAVLVRPPGRPRVVALGLPVAAGGVLAGWALLRGVTADSAAAGARAALLLAGLGAALLVSAELDRSGRRLLLRGVVAVGLFLAVAGWVAVAFRLEPWALPTAGFWRASSTVTYANANAAMLVPLAVLVAALLAARPRSRPLAMSLTLLLAGSAATLSRAGGVALVVGLVVLVVLRGRAVLWPVVVASTGAAVAFAGLLPSLSVNVRERPGLAMAALAGGLAMTAVLLRCTGRRRAIAIGGMLVALVAAPAIGGHAGLRVWHQRVNLDSPSRFDASTAALHRFAAHPLAGVGPGHAAVQTRTAAGSVHVQQYLHDEYLQVLTEYGSLAGVALLALIAGLARLLWRNRPGPGGERGLGGRRRRLRGRRRAGGIRLRLARPGGAIDGRGPDRTRHRAGRPDGPGGRNTRGYGMKRVRVWLALALMGVAAVAVIGPTSRPSGSSRAGSPWRSRSTRRPRCTPRALPSMCR